MSVDRSVDRSIGLAGDIGIGDRVGLGVGDRVGLTVGEIVGDGVGLEVGMVGLNMVGVIVVQLLISLPQSSFVQVRRYDPVWALGPGQSRSLVTTPQSPLSSAREAAQPGSLLQQMRVVVGVVVSDGEGEMVGLDVVGVMGDGVGLRVGDEVGLEVGDEIGLGVGEGVGDGVVAIVVG